MTVAAVTRMAVVRMLEPSEVSPLPPSNEHSDAFSEEAVKVTVRLPLRAAREMATRARATGLSRGAYLSTLIDGTQALPVGVDRRQVVTALAASTDQLALVVADLNDFARLVRRGMAPSLEQIGDAVTTLTREVRTHLRVASRLVDDLKPMATRRRDRGQSIDCEGAIP